MIHELSHFFQYYSGNESDEVNMGCEVKANFHAAFVDALIHENGPDVFVRIEEWLKEDSP